MVDAIVIPPDKNAGRTLSSENSPTTFVLNDIQEALTLWDQAATSGRVVCGRAQTSEWVRCWREHVNQDCVFVGASIEDRPFFLLPLEIVRMKYATIARFPGGSHANSNFPLLAEAMADFLTPQLMQAVVQSLHEIRPDIDLLALGRQLDRIDKNPNPLLHLDRITNPNPVLSTTLPGDFTSYLARFNKKRKLKKHRQQERRFEKAGDFRIRFASNTHDVDALLDYFFEIKAKRLKQAGIRDVFSDDKIRRFLKALAELSIISGKELLRIKALEVDGVPRAIIGVSIWMDTKTSEFGGISDDRLTAMSPGEYLYFQDLEESCTRGIATYSFGIGDETYKRRWCDTETALFDTYYGLNFKGKILASAMRMRIHTESALKKRTGLWKLVQRARRALNGQD